VSNEWPIYFVQIERVGYLGTGATDLRARMAVEPLAVVSDYPGLIAALRRRVVELGTTINAVDQLSGLPDGYVGKLLAPRMPKTMGMTSLPVLLGCLGLKLALVHDEAALAKVRDRLPPRQSPAGKQIREMASAE
jgi:hypothetical protein